MTPQRIIKIRQALGLTQEQLAERIYAHRSSVARWELGTHAPRGGYLKALEELEKKLKK